MRRIRYLVLAALGVFAALPMAKVYTVGAPWIERMELRNNDLIALQGRGVPGTQIGIVYRQRNFRPGCSLIGDLQGCCQGIPGYDCIPGSLLGYFELCGWLNGGNPLSLGSAQVTAAGTWRLRGLDTQVLPGASAGRTCDTGVLTQIELHSEYGNVSVPEVVYLQTEEPYPQPGQQRIGGRIDFANQVAAGVADGPNDVQHATAPWTIDTDEDGADLCTNGIGCGAPVRWKLGTGTWDPGGVATFLPPQIAVRDGSPLVGPRDQEFNHVMGMLQGHKPGGSVLAVAYVPRPTPVGLAFDVDVDMTGGGGGPGCDSAGGYFDFLP